MRGPCVKRRVVATIITPDGRRFVGENECDISGAVCPRVERGLPTLAGYEPCDAVHAESNALRGAGGEARGATLFLEDHTYACEPCRRACEAAGVTRIVIGAPPAS